MAGTPYLVDSNILLRWVKPGHSDYSLVVYAIDAILRRGDVLCYTSHELRPRRPFYAPSQRHGSRPKLSLPPPTQLGQLLTLAAETFRCVWHGLQIPRRIPATGKLLPCRP